MKKTFGILFALVLAGALGLLLALALIAVAVVPAYAQGEFPSPPHLFEGTARTLTPAAPVPAATLVQAFVGAELRSSTTTGANGHYYFEVPGEAGDWVTFKVAGVVANNGTAVQWISMEVTMPFHLTIPALPTVGYSLTMAVAPAGTGTATDMSGASPYAAGVQVSIKAVPAAGYRFVNWTAPAGGFTNASSATTTFTMPSQDVTVTANFDEGVEYTLTMAASPIMGGTVSAAPAGPYQEGAVITIQAVAASGYRFVSWTAPAGSFANANAPQTTFTMPAQGVTVAANFAVATEYTLTMAASPITGGTATDVTEASPYLQGEVVNIQAAAASGYRFVGWTAPAGSFANAYSPASTFIMPAQAVTVTARFVAGDRKTETVTNSTVDATAEADTKVAVTGTANVTVFPYDDNPGGPPPTGFSTLGKYIDVSLNDTTEVTETEIKLYYTDDEVTAAKIDEESLRLFWWNGTAWVQCSDSGVNTASNYIWAKIRGDTTPSLTDLQGTPWGGYGHPKETPQPCCMATVAAASGTNAANELDTLRKFRDEVLLPDSWGGKFVSFYYRTSPPIANFISHHDVLRTAVRVAFVDPIVAILNWTDDLWAWRGQ